MKTLLKSRNILFWRDKILNGRFFLRSRFDPSGGNVIRVIPNEGDTFFFAGAVQQNLADPEDKKEVELTVKQIKNNVTVETALRLGQNEIYQYKTPMFTVVGGGGGNDEHDIVISSEFEEGNGTMWGYTLHNTKFITQVVEGKEP